VPGLEAFAEQANAGLRVINIGSSSASLDPNFQKIFGLYMAGNVDLDQATQQVQMELDRSVQDYEKNNPDIDITSCMAG
jgi:raffinose/stachyose/melibiose transport system substrate-binding protein